MCRKSYTKACYLYLVKGKAMMKCMNHSDFFVDESLNGIIKAYPTFYRFSHKDSRGIVFEGNNSRKVKIITGGGYGHLPLFLGYVGKAMCDGIAVGNVFTSPSAETIMNVAREMETKQLLFLFGNYFGDTMNFEMAKEILESEGAVIKILKGADDLASSGIRNQRRGIAGIIFGYKIAGAAADQGRNLEEVVNITKKALENTSSLGVAFSSCTLPGEKKPIFTLEDNEIEIGMGIHGEPGIEHSSILSSEELAYKLAEECLADQKIKRNEKIAVLVNGLGSTSREELYIFYNDLEKIFLSYGINIVKTYVGEYVTSMEMAGLSLSIMRVDEELEKLLNVPAYSPLITL